MSISAVSAPVEPKLNALVEKKMASEMTNMQNSVIV